MPSTTAQDEFVDLYALLDLPSNADEARIRKTISERYLEAQKNLDHRNPRKRLQYQQMYEVYLPQARHLLLDANRRAEYDRYLKAFLSGQTIAAEPGEAAPPPKSRPDLPGAASAPEKPVELSEAEQAQMWSKWKIGLQDALEEETSKDNASNAASASNAAAASDAAAAPDGTTPAPPRLAPDAPTTPPAQTRATTAAPRPATPKPATPKPAPRPAARPAPRIAGAPPEEEEEKRRRQAAEFQRQQARMQMIQAAVQTAGWLWRLVGGVGAFAVGCLLVLGLDMYLMAKSAYPVLGLGRAAFNGLGIVVVMGLALVASNYASRRARRQKSLELSLLSYEELRRRTSS